MENYREQGKAPPPSPFGAVLASPEMETSAFFSMGMKYPIDVCSIKTSIANSLMLQHPLFTSIMADDDHGRPSWKKLATVNIDDHVLCHHYDDGAAATEEETDRAVNNFLSDLAVSSPMRRDKPLWEVHLLLGFNWVVLRVHHAVGDGVSIISMLKECFGSKKAPVGVEAGASGAPVANGSGEPWLPIRGEMISKGVKKRRKQWREKGLKGWIKGMWYTFVFIMMDLVKLVWRSDDKTVVSGGDGVELWPRRLVTVKFKLEEMYKIKQAIPDATINDVFMGVTSRGISKYLNLHSAPNALKKNLRLSSVFMVNVRAESEIQGIPALMKSRRWSGWGNRIGIFLVPLFLSKVDVHPLEHVKRMKSVLDKKKQSYEADLIYVFIRLAISLLGVKVGSCILRRFLQHTTILNSNIRGPQEEIEIGGNPVASMRVNISSLPHAIVMHMVSYAGKVELQALVTKDIILHPESLAKCFEESLHEMTNSIPAIP